MKHNDVQRLQVLARKTAKCFCFQESQARDDGTSEMYLDFYAALKRKADFLGLWNVKIPQQKTIALHIKRGDCSTYVYKNPYM